MCPPTPWMPHNGIDREISNSLELTFSSLSCFPAQQFWRLERSRGEKRPSSGNAMVSIWNTGCLHSHSMWALLVLTYTAPIRDSCWKSMTLGIVTGSFRPAAFFPASSIFTYKPIWSTVKQKYFHSVVSVALNGKNVPELAPLQSITTAMRISYLAYKEITKQLSYFISQSSYSGCGKNLFHMYD